MKEIIDFLSSFWNRWAILLILSVVLFALVGALFLKKKFNRIKFVRPTRIWILGVIVSAALMVGPVYYEKYGLHSIHMSLNHAIRLFVMDGGISAVLDELPEAATKFAYHTYGTVGGILYILAPAATAGFILSFFKNFMAYARYMFSSSSHIHVFSELNEKTLALASSIAGGAEGEGAQIIFADIIDKSEEQHLDLVDGAEKLGAIFFRKDLASIRFTKKKHSIYLISDDENEKIRHAKSIIENERYSGDKNKQLYIFSDSPECKCFMDSFSDDQKNAIQMKTECINDIRFLIYHYLDEHGIELFKNARQEDGVREISAAVVGFGRYGEEMVKALLWYCQIPGFKIRITVLDKDENAESRARVMFPGIALEDDAKADGDMRYFLKVVSGVEVGTAEFNDKVKEELGGANHVFVMLGSDSENISACTTLRRCLEHNGRHDTEISTVLYNTALCENVDVRRMSSDTANSKMKKMNINAFGDIASFYSEGTVINSTLVKEGLDVHESWSDAKKEFDNTYYMDDYNFYSSVAKALHYRLRKRIMEECTESASIFPEIFYYETDSRIRFIMENTVSVEKAVVLRETYTALLSKLPCLDGNRVLAKLICDDELMSQNVDASIGGELGVKTLADVIYIAKAAADIDHVRWNAYMRTEGFIKGDKSVEYRRHHNLVSVGAMQLSECIKDI